MHIDNAQVNVITEYLTKKIHPWLIILFGSSVKGNFRPDSDIDIAFMSDADIDDYELFMTAQELAVTLGRDVDLLDLKKITTVMKAQVIGCGKVIFSLDEIRRMEFFIRSFKEYALLNEERAHILDKIRERGTIYE